MENIKTNSFIEEIIENDLESGKHKTIITRFPPEPNGYLHIGHAKSLSINFGAKAKFNGKCNLRFDDTNPSKEDVEYVDSIQEDIKWLGYQWDKMLYASDYFERMFKCAVILIKKGLAYVCDMSADEMHDNRGTLTEPGKESPYRNRSIEENLDLFNRMRAGEFADGEKILRAKIDMASPNINMRDPGIYRILRAKHHRTGDKWLIYPIYDFAHPLEDAFEDITHSLCSLEFEDHRPLYNWVRDNCGFIDGPRQIEFARLNVTRTIMSKRYLKKLVDNKVVEGWDDPRMPTICGMRMRGYPPEAIKDFCDRIGVAKANSLVNINMLEHCVRENLNNNAIRVMVVKNPIKLTITNYPLDKSVELVMENHPMNPEMGSHKVTFSRNLLIDSEDFQVIPEPKYFRLKPGGIVRLKGSYIVEYTAHKTDSEGNVIEVECKYLPDTESGAANAGMKCKGVIHWVSEKDAVDIIVNEYDYLLDEREDVDFSERLNHNSKKIIHAKAESYIRESKPFTRYQFMRMGYYMATKKFSMKNLEFNAIVGLKDNYNK